MKYFIDTEFIEGFHKPLFGKRRHFIDLISIGIVCEDGREYYAISKNFNPKNADSWVKENVISKLPLEKISLYDSPRIREESLLWKYQNQITFEVLQFFGCEYDNGFWAAPEGIEVYGYYADYDWVLFCSLFGRMIDLPKGFPMYCRDLKQMLDESFSISDDAVEFIKEFKKVGSKKYPSVSELSYVLHNDKIKEHADYPKQENEHNALDDAKWNYELYKFIQTL